jgi:hypothetical protein
LDVLVVVVGVTRLTGVCGANPSLPEESKIRDEIILDDHFILLLVGVATFFCIYDPI